MQTIGDRIWYRIHAFVLEKIAERLNEVGFTGGYLDAGHLSGGASTTLSHSATGHTSATLGNVLYAAAAGAWTLLAGNTTATRKFLRQTGTGAVSAAPAWDTLVDGDLPTTLAGKTLTTATLTAPTIADFTNAQHDHADTDDGGAISGAGAHDHTAADGSGVLTNDEHDGYGEYTEIAAPSTPAANKLRLYAKDSGGLARLFYKDDGGTERGPLDTPGAASSHDHTTADGSGVLTGDEHDSFSEYVEIAAPSTPASGKVRFYPKSDGKFYRKDDAGVEAELGGGGSVTNDNYSIDSGSTNDIGPIFPLTALVIGDFTAVNQGSATATTEGNGVHLHDPTVDASINYRIWKKAAPSVPYAIKMLILPKAFPINFHQLCMGWRQASDGKLALIRFLYNNGWQITSTTASGPTADVANYATLSNMPPPSFIWLGIEDDNTNRIVSYSFDGKHFKKAHSVARTDYLTGTEVMVALNARNSLEPCGMTVMSWVEETTLNYV